MVHLATQVHLSNMATMKKILLLSLLLTIIAGCQGQNRNKNMEKPTGIQFSLGEPFDVFAKRYPAIKKQHHAGPEGGANFYQFSWLEDKPAEIKVKFDSNEVTINNAISLMVTEFVYKNDEGITSARIKSGITYDKKISHDEARLKFHEFLQGLLDKGWKRRLSYTHPRLSGTVAMHYMREYKSSYSLDPNYLPTMKEWMSVDRSKSMHWGLQAENKAFISIKLQRKTDKENPDIGVYLLSISIENDQEMGRSHFLPEEKKDWNDQEKWDSTKEKFLKIRAQAEKDLLSKGYKIDESYEDYEINPRK